jgi:GntR family transcriptional regulator
MKIIVSNSSNDPIYEQIVKQLKTQIINGELKPGSILPSIRSLARKLQISVITTKRAYDELEKDGFIDTVGGKGTFVANQNKELLREMRMRIVEEKLGEAIDEARNLGINAEELKSMLSLLYREED